MTHLLIIAGVPAAIYDDVLSAGPKKLASGEAKIISRPLHPMASGHYRYRESYANQLIGKLADAVGSALAGTPNKRLYILFMYINYDDCATVALVRRFSCFALPQRLTSIQLAGLSRKKIAEQKNDLIELINRSAKRMRRNLGVWKRNC